MLNHVSEIISLCQPAHIHISDSSLPAPVTSPLPHAVNRVRFCFWCCLWLACVWNIPGIAKRICAKFATKTCLAPRSEEFEGQGQRSKVKGHQEQKRDISADISGTAERFCDTFTRKTCLVSGSNEFEGQEFRRPACGLCLEKHFCSSFSVDSPLLSSTALTLSFSLKTHLFHTFHQRLSSSLRVASTDYYQHSIYAEQIGCAYFFSLFFCFWFPCGFSAHYVS